MQEPARLMNRCPGCGTVKPESASLTAPCWGCVTMKFGANPVQSRFAARLAALRALAEEDQELEHVDSWTGMDA